MMVVGDSFTMIGRSMRHAVRNFDSLLFSVILPIMLLLLFVYVFGGAIETNTAYVNYVVPGIILLCAGYGAANTAVSVASDMTTGIIDRFRSLPSVTSALLIGHVVASLIRNMFSTAVVLGVALLMGFRPTANMLEWMGVLVVVALFILAISWVSTCFGLIAKSTEAASGFTFFVLFLPYVSSAFVPTDTMPAALQFFAENQPVTPVIETVRGLLMGGETGNSPLLAVLWCGGILVVGYVVSVFLFKRKTNQ